jgi:hypothetical protein
MPAICNNTRCRRCGRAFTPKRRTKGTLFCSDACRQAAYRDRRPRPWVLVVWSRDADMLASFSYWPTEAAAIAHAPHDGRVSTVVNGRRKPWVTIPHMNELLFHTRLEAPPPDHVRVKARWTGI